MKYLVKSGVWYEIEEESVLKIAAQFKQPFWKGEKKVLGPDQELLIQTRIRSLPVEAGKRARREYEICDREGNTIATGTPEYAGEEDPKLYGWPVCRVPRSDHVDITWGDKHCRLVMQNSQNYVVLDENQGRLMDIVHLGLKGGWRIESREDIPLLFACGFFVFCRYLDQENDFVIV